MIDLHTHILYGMDDGAQTLDEAIEMVRLAADDGIKTLVATPHSPESTACRQYSPQLIYERLAELRAALAGAGVDVELVAGTEVAYAADVVPHLRAGRLLPYGTSRAILLEMPNSVPPQTLEIALFNLQVAGYRVVLAHPERIVEVQRDPNVLVPLVDRGALMQLTAGALLGDYGSGLRQVCEVLLAHDLAHVLASDAHDSRGRRLPVLSAARERARALVGPDRAEQLVRATPAAILRDQPLDLPPPRRVGRARR